MPDALSSSPYSKNLLTKAFEKRYREVLAELITFRMVVNEKGIQKCAAKLGRPHGTISARIRKLDLLLGGDVLIHSEHKTGHLTQLGQKLLECTDVVLHALEQVLTVADSLQNSDRVKVACLHSLWMAEGERLEKDFKERFSRLTLLAKSGQKAAPANRPKDGVLDVRFDFTESEAVKQEIEARTYDVGIVSYPPTQRSKVGPSVIVRKWHDEEMVLVASRSSGRLKGKRIASNDAFKVHDKIILYAAHLPISHPVDKFLRDQRVGFSPGQRQRMASIAEIKEAVANDYGIGILPKPSVERDERFSWVPLERRLIRPLGILYHSDDVRPVLRAFVDCFKDEPARKKRPLSR